jgi:hypothetical protein
MRRACTGVAALWDTVPHLHVGGVAARGGLLGEAQIVRCIPTLHALRCTALLLLCIHANVPPCKYNKPYTANTGTWRPVQVYTVFDWDHWRAIGAYAGAHALLNPA